MNNVNNIIRHIKQNKKSILIILGAFAGIVLIVQVLNGFTKESLENSSKNVKNTINNTNTSSVYQPNKTILSNTTIKESTAKENTEIIEQFIDYCNNGEVEKAYDLLTDECKENLYNNVNSFNNNYCKKIFTDKKEYNIQSWITYSDIYTYKVRFTENLLATGNNNSNSLEDYITIVKNNDELKLNINSYVARVNINKERTSHNITINIKYKDIYIDKEVYGVNATNNSENEIMLDSLNTLNGIQLIGENNTKYQALTNELSKYDVTVPIKNTKLIKIKVSKGYNNNRMVKKIIFSDIILDTGKYMLDKNNEVNKTTINVEL